ncbi:transcriptional regulator, AraC family [Fibrisoma limi BUZ 3]|uniref:Transcriptional regulator, AraC family n=1 Tax=Fibrisoma limi BUZ 3 TaxID=1185876 RepID=I2GFJ2_9BACT|nr:helix-turn-helix domain-containing protein [Fibrisoma limi]CCH52667.1 transcriptional regulator, AraC family [Fibrisoma limi BUZ 3]
MKPADPIPTYRPDAFANDYLVRDQPIPADWSLSTMASGFAAVYRIEQVRQFFRFPIAPNRITFYDGLLLTAGTLHRQCGLYDVQLTPNSLLVLAPDTINATDFISEDVTGFYFHFDREFFVTNLATPDLLDTCPFFEAGNEPFLNLTNEQSAWFTTLLGLTEQILRANSPDSARGLLQALIVRATQLHQRQPESSTSSPADIRLTAAFKRLVQQQYVSWHGVSQYADALAVTPNHLNRVVKRTTARPASFHVATLLILEAKLLLKNSQLSVAEIAAKLHFDDPAYFGRFFRQQTGQTPTAYRHSA